MANVKATLSWPHSAVADPICLHDMPNALKLADIAEEAAWCARRLGYDTFKSRHVGSIPPPFGDPQGERSEAVFRMKR